MQNPDVDPFLRELVVVDPSSNVGGGLGGVLVALDEALAVVPGVGVMAVVMVSWELDEGGVRVVLETEAVSEDEDSLVVVVVEDELKPSLSKKRACEHAAQRATDSKVRLLMAANHVQQNAENERLVTDATNCRTPVNAARQRQAKVENEEMASD